MNSQKVQINQCDMKTDLNLLLECLKYQMDCPLSQKEALITIYSICQQNTEQLSLKLYDNSLNVNNTEELDVQVRKRCLQDYWKKAKEILHRINSIEKQHDEDIIETGRTMKALLSKIKDKKPRMVKACSFKGHVRVWVTDQTHICVLEENAKEKYRM